MLLPQCQVPFGKSEKAQSPMQYKPTLLCCKEPWCQHTVLQLPLLWLGKTEGQDLPAVTNSQKLCLQAHTARLSEPPSVNSTGNPCPWLHPHAVTLMEICLWAGLLQNWRPVSKLRRPKDEEGLKVSEISQVLKATQCSFCGAKFPAAQYKWQQSSL